MLKSAVPLLASLSEEETVKFYIEKLGFTFHSSWKGILFLAGIRYRYIYGPVKIPKYQNLPAATSMLVK